MRTIDLQDAVWVHARSDTNGFLKSGDFIALEIDKPENVSYMTVRVLIIHLLYEGGRVEGIYLKNDDVQKIGFIIQIGDSDFIRIPEGAIRFYASEVYNDKMHVLSLIKNWNEVRIFSKSLEPSHTSVEQAVIDVDSRQYISAMIDQAVSDDLVKYC